ncbi:acetylxylan esterase [Paenibacillus profundus]|uniref:Acetylxylan esterase n=1 Tax=Paenibacillus profundus TaxID=1173085 RepID=A0ABS8Y9J3_9BACL|nr:MULTISPECIES: alpha/beta fold hydrolase [Paenibacillus]MCE5167759.1 acetylxylan esterase [Paenibacillus profundus]
MNALELRKHTLLHATADSYAPSDFTDFWQETLHQAEQRPMRSVRKLVNTPYPYMKVYDVTYEGFDETPIHGWFIVPAVERYDGQPVPCVLQVHGYTGSRGMPEDYAMFVLMGYAVFAIDIRGQGGDTGNELPLTSGMVRGWITQGITDPKQCYYRAVAVDAWRAFKWLCEQPEVDAARIAAAGSSQGGGLALLLASLEKNIAAVVAGVPNLCHMDYALMHSAGSISEASDYVARHPERLEQVIRTLSYFDLLHHAHLITQPVLMSVSWKDPICLPETIYAVYNRMTSPKQILDYPFSGHENGGGYVRNVAEFLKEHLGTANGFA